MLNFIHIFIYFCCFSPQIDCYNVFFVSNDFKLDINYPYLLCKQQVIKIILYKIIYNTSSPQDGGDVILTLEDKDVLAEENDDVLVNVNIKDIEKVFFYWFNF